MESLAAVNKEKWLQLILRRTINAPTWSDFNLLLQKELTSKVDNTKRSSTVELIGSFYQDTKRRTICRYAYARTTKKGRRARPTSNHSPEWTNRFSPILKQRHEFEEIKQNRAIVVRIKRIKDFIKVRRKQLYNKHLIRRLTSQYGWVFLLVDS